MGIEENSQLKVGDRVRVVKYGHIIMGTNLHQFKEVAPGHYDLMPELVGQVGRIDIVGENGLYAVDLDKQSKHAWYEEEQLEKVECKKGGYKSYIDQIEYLGPREPYDADQLNRYTSDEAGQYDGAHRMDYLEDEYPRFAGKPDPDLKRTIQVLKMVNDYCHQAGCTPEDLINAHQSFLSALKRQLMAEHDVEMQRMFAESLAESEAIFRDPNATDKMKEAATRFKRRHEQMIEAWKATQPVKEK